MLRELFDRFLEVGAQVNEKLVLDPYGDGRKFIVGPANAVEQARCKTLVLQSLTGLVDYCNQHPDGAWPLPEAAFLHVESPVAVSLLSPIHGPCVVRDTIVAAHFKGETRFPFNRFMSQTEFIIGLQAGFERTVKLDELLGLVGNLKDEAVVNAVDDGVSQVATVKGGVTLVNQKKVEPRWTLHPFRTWPELDQPGLECILRLAGGGDEKLPTVGLFTVEDPQWARQTMDAAAKFLREKTDRLVLA